IVSELVAYKQIGYAVRVFSRAGRKLKIIGDGPEYKTIKKLGGSSIQFCGRVSDSEVREMMARSRGLLLPGEEDFGITPVEALASGKPVIALGRGGALETVPTCDPLGGVLYDQATEDSLEGALQKLDQIESQIVPGDLQRWAARFSEAEFRSKME